MIASATRTPRLYAWLTTLFGLLAATLAIVGVYSVTSYAVAQRGGELSIRAALGASRRALLHLVLTDGVATIGLGVGAGLAGAVAVSRLMRSLLYQVNPADPVVLGLTAGGVAAAATLGYLIPAMRATARVQPAISMRAE